MSVLNETVYLLIDGTIPADVRAGQASCLVHEPTVLNQGPAKPRPDPWLYPSPDAGS